MHLARIPPRRSFAGIKVSPMERSELLSMLGEAFTTGSPVRVTFLNPDYSRRALLDPPLAAAINSFDVVAVDGNGVRLLSPLFGFRVPARLDTDSVAPHIFDLCAEQGRKVFLFGCAPGVAAEAGRVLATAFPGISVTGTEHGFHDVTRGHPGRFDPIDSHRIVQRMNDSHADLVVVSLPTPLQQEWVAAHGGRITAPVVMTAGSYLDHVAEGEARHWYPHWADVLRLNWFYRLIRDPRRLWRRYTVEIVHFAFLVVRYRLTPHR